jgi:amidase
MLDRQGPRVQAVLSINPDALAQAKQADLDVLNNKALGALHGIPILVKDNIETSELATTAGSLALLNNKTNRDAPIIAKLKAQGAIILGKTNLSEWANFRSNDSVSGWSAIGGQTRNPHSLERTPCGSSSGSGAAIASRMAPLAIGTETNGSIICPSAMNGVVGVKPTVGMLSRTHIVPISVTQDTAGPMTRSVKDAALMLSAMAGNDPQDPATANADQYATDFAAELDKSIKGKKIGVFKAVQSDHPEIIAAFEKASKQLEAMGAELVVIDTFETPENFWTNALNVLLIEFKHELNKYLASTPKSVESRTLEDLIAFNQNNEREFAIFDQSLFLQAQDTNGYDEEYKTALAFLRNATRTNGIDKLLKDYDVDAIIMPSQTPAFLIESVYGDSFAGGFAGAGWLAAIAGYPHVSVPMGQMKGLPINLSFIAGQWDDAMLLNIAYQYEQASQQLIEPTFPASAIEHPYFKDKLVPLEL